MMDEEGPFTGGEYGPEVVDLGAVRAEQSMAKWSGRLVKTDKHVTLPIVSNALVLLANLPSLQGMLGYNEFTNEPQLLRAPPPPEEGAAPMAGPYPRAWSKADVILVQAFLQRAWNPKFSAETAGDAMMAHAYRNRFHPIRDWLDGLRWDGKPRLDSWLEKAFGRGEDETDETKKARCEIGAKFLIAAVRRVRKPGCKFDHMLVLEGLQGQGKSGALRALFSEEYFTDDLQDLRSKEGAVSLQGVWGVEVAELDRLLRVEAETTKAFLTRQVDRYRPAYERRALGFPRQVVLAGTTNRNDWLRDPTGNRRYWPVACYHADPEWITEQRAQLWAEAAAREASGEAIWLDDADSQQVMREAQAERMSEDMWSEPVGDYLAENLLAETSVPMLLTYALGMPRERQDKRSEMRVAAVLTQMGWTRHVGYASGNTTRRIWRKPETEEPPKS